MSNIVKKEKEKNKSHVIIFFNLIDFMYTCFLILQFKDKSSHL